MKTLNGICRNCGNEADEEYFDEKGGLVCVHCDGETRCIENTAKFGLVIFDDNNDMQCK